jgi:hypothetical protein
MPPKSTSPLSTPPLPASPRFTSSVTRPRRRLAPLSVVLSVVEPLLEVAPLSAVDTLAPRALAAVLPSAVPPAEASVAPPAAASVDLPAEASADLPAAASAVPPAEASVALPPHPPTEFPRLAPAPTNLPPTPLICNIICSTEKQQQHECKECNKNVPQPVNYPSKGRYGYQTEKTDPRHQGLFSPIPTDESARDSSVWKTTHVLFCNIFVYREMMIFLHKMMKGNKILLFSKKYDICLFSTHSAKFPHTQSK